MFLGGSYDAGTFPSEEEVEPVLDGLRSLSDTAKKRLRTFSADKQKIETGAEGGVVGFPPSESVVEEDQELLSAGFIQRVSVTGKDQAFFGGEPFIYRLTENGAVAGRVLNATGEVPEWAVPIIGSASEA
jgi:hypothetical protein